MLRCDVLWREPDGCQQDPDRSCTAGDIFVVVEIPQGSAVKYEVDKESGAIFVDRISVHGNGLSIGLRLHPRHARRGWRSARCTGADPDPGGARRGDPRTADRHAAHGGREGALTRRSSACRMSGCIRNTSVVTVSMTCQRSRARRSSTSSSATRSWNPSKWVKVSRLGRQGRGRRRRSARRSPLRSGRG